MSHSSLSAQLASLHSKNTTSSRQHDDAIGRGFHHSTNAGHSIVDGGTKHKPTVLYADSRAAAHADIPFTTMRDNGVISLQYLSRHTSPLFDLSNDDLPWQTLFGSKSVKYERGINNQDTNFKYDGMVKEALYLLSTCWGDVSSAIATSSNIIVQLGANVPSSVLHILEYLIQKYYAHVHNSETLLIAFLPHHETFLFDRIIQLIDLAQLPHWAFLRPYSAAKGVLGVPRTVIAKWSASTKNNGGGFILMKKICDLAKRGAKIQSLELQSSADDVKVVRRGLSLIISFAVAVLAESLHIQYTTIGTIEESTLRSLVPYLLSAVEPSSSKGVPWSLGARCPEWRAFGYVLISLLAEKCNLSAELYEAFTVGIVRGGIESAEFHKNKQNAFGSALNGDDKYYESFVVQSVFDSCTDSLLALTSISSMKNTESKHKENEDGKMTSFLPCTNLNQLIGCSLSLKCFKSLMKVPSLHLMLGYLFREKRLNISNLLGAISAMTVSSVSSAEVEVNEVNSYLKVLLLLVSEPSLATAWHHNDSTLSSALSSFVISRIDNHTDESVFRLLSGVLSELRKADVTGCDFGIAHAITSQALRASKFDPERSEVVKAFLKAAGLSSSEILPKRNVNDHMSTEQTEIDSLDRLLPPRVALEHQNSQMRLSAISTLTSNYVMDSNINDTVEALFRRFAYDDNDSVALAAGEGLLKLLLDQDLYPSIVLRHNILDDTFYALEQAQKSKDSPIFKVALNLSEFVIKALNEYTTSNEDILSTTDDYLNHYFDRFLMIMVGLVDRSVDSCIVASMISKIFGFPKTSKSRLSICKDLCHSLAFQNFLKRSFSEKQFTDDEGVMNSVLLFTNTVSEMSTKDFNGDIVSLLMDSFTFILCHNSEYIEKFTASLKTSLDRCCEYLEKKDDLDRISEIIRFLLSVQSDDVFKRVSLSCINNLKTSPSYTKTIADIICSTKSPISSVLHSLDLIKECCSETAMTPIFFISIISLLGHIDLKARRSALEFILVANVSKDDDMKSAINALRSACNQRSQQSNILMDGSTYLPNVFASATLGPDGSIFRLVLLKGCSSVIKDLISAKRVFWKFDGIFHQISNILSIAETAGELYFPLLLRWSESGRDILNLILKQKFDHGIPIGLISVIESAVTMLKGVKIDSDICQNSVIISTGPTVSGHRNRSYSIGTFEGITALDLYPTEMKEVVLIVLSTAIKAEEKSFEMQVCDILNRQVLARNSWASSVFSGLDLECRQTIASNLLKLRCEKQLESAGHTLKMLPLTSSEFSYVLTSYQNALIPQNSLHIAILSDCIRTRAPHLSKDKHLSQLIALLYDQLTLLSQKETTSDEGSDYTRTCIIHALMELTCNMNRGNVTKKLEKDISAQCKFLVSLLGGSSSDVKALVSNRSKYFCLKLLTELCALAPTVVVESLIPAMIGVISSNQANTSSIRSTLDAIIPAYCKHALESGLTMYNLLFAFIHQTRSSEVSWNEKKLLLSLLHESLISSVNHYHLGQVSASLLTAYIASEAINFIHAGFDVGLIDDESPIRLVQIVLSEVAPVIQIDASLCMLHVVEKIFSLVNGSPSAEQKTDFFSMKVDDIPKLFFCTEDQQQHKMLALMWTSTAILELVKVIYTTPNVKRMIRLCDDSQARVCLNIWQELMTLQCTATLHASEIQFKVFWTKICAELNVAVSSLQTILPVPHFLASVSSIVDTADTDVDIKRRAISLLSERGCEIDPTSPESILFLDMLPELMKLSNSTSLKTKVSRESNSSLLLSQSSWRTIDAFVKHFGLGIHDEQLLKKRFGVFNPVIQTVTNCISTIANDFSFHDMEKDVISCSVQLQVLGAAALCASSLVSLLKAKCVSILPKLVSPLLQLLKASNRFKKETFEKDIESDTHQSVLFVQVSTLRVMIALSENLPQFFVTYIGNALSVDGIPSRFLRLKTNQQKDDSSASSLVERLEASISAHLPSRQLLPVLSQATSECISSVDSLKESVVLLKLMKMSIDNAQRSDVGTMAGKILHALLRAYSIESDARFRLMVVDGANNTLLSMVLKLSEAQLRPLYSKLREWRGDLEENNLFDFSHTKRYAFWSLSAVMAKELRSLFLPCLSSVVGDVVKELVFASKILCSRTLKGNKRQRVSDVPDHDVSNIVGPLQSVLMCLEASLKADAHDGGNWIRRDEGERYTQILTPLGKLLSAEIPRNTMAGSSIQDNYSNISPYQELVQGVGTEDQGTVVGCLSALATAAGNEQLWKPLNHILLEACGNRHRPDVRKSGVKCLLSIIHSLGEEYMVLLPECLPILSELLEDEDEDIVAIAKECIQQGEELIGESLEDSLR